MSSDTFLSVKQILKGRAVSDTGTEPSALQVLDIHIGCARAAQYQLSHLTVNLHIHFNILFFSRASGVKEMLLGHLYAP